MVPSSRIRPIHLHQPEKAGVGQGRLNKSNPMEEGKKEAAKHQYLLYVHSVD